MHLSSLRDGMCLLIKVHLHVCVHSRVGVCVGDQRAVLFAPGRTMQQ